MDNAKNERKTTTEKNKQKGAYVGSKICSANPLIAGQRKTNGQKIFRLAG